MCTRPEVAHENVKSVDEYSDDFELESGEVLPASVMRSLFASGNSLVHLELGGSRDEDDAWLAEQVEDVHVSDPMLNQLTHIERFTDSSGAFCSGDFDHELTQRSTERTSCLCWS